jgi:outer membrane protein assembly factor BamB
MARVGDRELCLCLDESTGETLWSHEYAQPFQTHPGARSAGLGPKATPTVDGDSVFMHGIDGRFHCFDVRTGQIRWVRDFAAEFWGVEKDAEGYDRWKTLCGAAASPLIEGNLVVVPVGGKKAGAITAFDKKTGKLAWKALDDRSTYASPIAAHVAGRRQIVGFTGRRIAGFDAADGKLLWDYPFEVDFDDTIVTPIVWKELVIACGGDKPSAALRITENQGKFERTVVWENKNLRCNMSTPIVHDDHLYGVANSGRLVCVELATGKTAWIGEGLGVYASLVRDADQLLALSQAGVLHVIDLTPMAFRSRARITVIEDGETWAHLAIAGSRLYIRDKEHLHCFDLASSP